MTTPFEETAIARRYEPLRELGSGGMGTVYLVADRFRGGEQVALKTIHPERLRHLDKFRQEFTVLSKLRHPHLLRVIDFGSTPAPEERFFFTSEYVAGQRLDTWAAGKGLVPLLQVLTQLTEVLHHLHARNVLHLDIKPDNLLVTGGNGEPVSSRLIDLGLARFRQQQDQETSGTVHFMSPEQIT
ncbi:MAG: serine/threonine protein kinase, partial [Myxococcales bacterium]|nr:serine/threonine protein kinase [Myxococcales bacterium]